MKHFVSITFALILSVLLAPKAFATPTAVAAQVVSETAAAVSYTSADSSNGNSVSNDGTVFLVVKNTNASAASVVVTPGITTRSFPGYGVMTKAAITVSLAQNDVKVLGPFPTAVWNDSSGKLQITYTGAGVAGVSIAPMKLTP